MIRAFVALLALTALVACSGDRGLRRLGPPGAGPDEFSVLPNAPLDLPADFRSLPAPTPGGTNRSDLNPRADAVAALGGNAAALRAGGIPASDQALVVQVSRNGGDPAIRSILAQEDEQFRRNRARLGRGLFGGDRYFQAYSGQSLDAYAEWVRFRNLGVAVPSAPPAP